MSEAATPAPPPNPRRGHQRHLVAFLRAALVLVAALGTVALVLPDPLRRPVAIAMVVTLVATPVIRIGWLVLRWVRRRDWRFAAAGLALLGVLAAGLALGR